ncbi:chorismate lyase [Maricurvus nonylphenolicus]|uniref:chorismate--pyruvate lyase family protein n=1 Tax=Maricurvus nonylphenolicus TaxID=1008307 RepID=UPI0036F277A6
MGCKEPSWHNRPTGHSKPSTPLSQWLFDRGSLTSRLQHLSHGQFRVEVLSQGWGKPRLSEARSLGISPRRYALVREVILYGQDQPWVYARSILPQCTLTGRLRSLRKLDNRPLGAMLFNDPAMYRSPIEIACFKADNPLIPQKVRSTTPLWGRRSRFYLDNKPLLVCEIFLDAFNQTLSAQ